MKRCERLNKLVELGNGYVVLDGATGTLLELACIWELKNKGFNSTDKPIIIVGQFWKGLVDLIGRIDAGSVGCVQTVDTPIEAVEMIPEAGGEAIPYMAEEVVAGGGEVMQFVAIAVGLLVAAIVFYQVYVRPRRKRRA